MDDFCAEAGAEVQQEGLMFLFPPGNGREPKTDMVSRLAFLGLNKRGTRRTLNKFNSSGSFYQTALQTHLASSRMRLSSARRSRSSATSAEHSLVSISPKTSSSRDSVCELLSLQRPNRWNI